MKDKKTNGIGERGFSLIEVMIAILILTIGLLSLAQMMMIAANSNALSGRMTASAALAKEQLELLKAAPFYLNPADISVGGMNPMLVEGGSLTSDDANYHQYYDPDGQPLVPNGPNGAAYRVRWQIRTVVPPGGDMPLAMLQITVRCEGLGAAYRFVGDATLKTFRTANIG
jgi:prepilin-type N-terminal cleavage/methylation domain-containing protein